MFDGAFTKNPPLKRMDLTYGEQGKIDMILVFLKENKSLNIFSKEDLELFILNLYKNHNYDSTYYDRSNDQTSITKEDNIDIVF